VTKPNPENCKNCSSKCAYDCTASVHNTTQNSSDNLPSYLQTTVIAQMSSIGGQCGQPLRALTCYNKVIKTKSQLHQSVHIIPTWINDRLASSSSSMILSSNGSTKSPATRKCRKAAICSVGGRSLQRTTGF